MSARDELALLRNLGIVAHIDAGKTTVSERILFDSGVEHRAGLVDEGTTVLDWMPEERERGITITAAATRVPWRGHAINLIDTPGHVDFTVEVERCMRVLDGAVLVLDGVVGVQAQSETVWRQMRRHRVPYVAFVNKCDRPGADFLAAQATLASRLGERPLPVQFPILQDGELVAIADLIRGETIRLGADGRGIERLRLPWPRDCADEIALLRAELCDALSEKDERLMELLLEEREVGSAELVPALRERVLARELVPVLCGAALRNIGVHSLLDAVVDWLPSPADLPPVRGREPESGALIERLPEPGEPFCALAFKLHAGPHGDLTFVRVYSGSVTPGSQVLNPRTGRKERVMRILRIHAQAGQQLERAGAGDIVALVGLKSTGTGDTLCDPGAPIVLERLELPLPVITRVVEPSSAAERDKLQEALTRLAHEDPSLQVREDEDTGQWLVSGMGELHLEVVEHRLRDEFRVTPAVGHPRVAYREAPLGTGRGRGRVERILNGKEIFGALELEVRRAEAIPGARVEFRPDLGLPKGHRQALEETLAAEAQTGPRFGYPLVQAEVRVLACELREGRKDPELGYVQAGVLALREALSAAGVELLEPLMAFEIQAPAEFTGGIIADLSGRAADLREVRADGELRIVGGTVPLSKMVGYATAVRSLSQGRASFSMEPAGFRGVPEGELASRGLVWS